MLVLLKEGCFFSQCFGVMIVIVEQNFSENIALVVSDILHMFPATAAKMS